MSLTDREKEQLKALIDAGEKLPPRYRATLFAEPREAELIWPGKTAEVTNVALPFQSIEQIDEPRAETFGHAADLFAFDAASGRQTGGWTNKLIWGDNKLVLSSLKNGPLRREIEAAGGLKLVYIDPPFDVGADFSVDIEIGDSDRLTKEPSVLEEVAYRDTWGRGADSYLTMIHERLRIIYDLMSPDASIYVHIGPQIGPLRLDFDGLRIFHDDPILPPNGHEGQNWQDDFQLTLHVQDQIGHVADTGNIFLSNIHRVYEGAGEPAPEDANTADYFMGKRPTGKTTDSQVDLGLIIREVPDLVVLNDEAHHIHDPRMAWFRSIEDIAMRLRQKGSQLSAQFDLTATPKNDRGAIFVQTISDYPLVEAIRQGVVKTPVLPDQASRAKLRERKSAKFTEQYEDYLHLGYLEWKKVYAELLPTGKKSVLFVMTDDTRNCDEVAAYLESRFPELAGAVLVIHTKNNGEISEASSGKNKDELDRLRKLSREIDRADNPYKAIVSVMVLREGWDVQNVVAIVGLRPFTASSKILPEQTLGRGLRRMFRGEPVQEKVSVIGTEAFMDFVESIKVEGVELEYQPMGEKTGPKSPIVVEVDRDDKTKDIDRLDIELPVLAPRIYREYKNLNDLDVTRLPHKRVTLKRFTAEQQREIVFRDINTETESHTTVLDSAFEPSYQSVVGFFARSIMRDLRLVGGFDVLFGKVKAFVETELFDRAVDLNDLNVLRNLSETEAHRTLVETFKTGVNALTVQDRGTTEIRDSIKLSRTRPYLVKDQAYLAPKKSVFNKIVGDSDFELEFASFLDGCEDIVSFVKNTQSTQFRMEYRNADGSIANYVPDFVVKKSDGEIWIVETKGREDLDDPPKWERLKQWCVDASKQDGTRSFRPLLVKEDAWDAYRARSFEEAASTYRAAD